jgi:hypothetical protein
MGAAATAAQGRRSMIASTIAPICDAEAALLNAARAVLCLCREEVVEFDFFGTTFTASLSRRSAIVVHRKRKVVAIEAV